MAETQADAAAPRARREAAGLGAADRGRDGRPRSRRTRPEVYAREAVLLHDEPERELKLQAIRIGELGITAIPDEVFAITGLKLKAQSPLAPTFNIELANGGEGYIPPPEQHTLGGYTTWPARTAGLEVQAEPKIVETVLGLLEQVAGKPRREPPPSRTAPTPRPCSPPGRWPTGGWTSSAGPRPRDATGRRHDRVMRSGVALYLRRPAVARVLGRRARSTAPVHFAGGRLRRRAAATSGHATAVELWFWNGLPEDARAVTGYLFAPAMRAISSRSAEPPRSWDGCSSVRRRTTRRSSGRPKLRRGPGTTSCSSATART